MDIYTMNDTKISLLIAITDQKRSVNLIIFSTFNCKIDLEIKMTDKSATSGLTKNPSYVTFVTSSKS